MVTYQSRRWCGTFWPEDDEDIDPGEEVLEWAEYFLWAEEFGEESHKRHSQFYIFTKKKCTLSSIKKRLEACGYHGAHVDPARGTHDEAINYILGPYEKKDAHGKVIKSKPVNESAKAYGNRPLESGDQTKQDWEDVRNLARQGRFDEIPAKYDVCFTRNLRYLHNEARDAEDLAEPCGVFIWGHSGAGKSYDARSMVEHDRKKIYLKGWNKWWDNYRGQELILLEDADPEKVKGLDQDIKIWADRYAFCPEVKGASAGMIRPKYIVITSQYSMEELFKDKETLWALRRRFVQKRKWIDPTTKERKCWTKTRYTADQCRDQAKEKEEWAGVSAETAKEMEDVIEALEPWSAMVMFDKKP